MRCERKTAFRSTGAPERREEGIIGGGRRGDTTDHSGEGEKREDEENEANDVDVDDDVEKEQTPTAAVVVETVRTAAVSAAVGSLSCLSTGPRSSASLPS
jgi:hypothetical protein